MLGPYHTKTADCQIPIDPLPDALYFPFTPMCFKGCCPQGLTCVGGAAVLQTCPDNSTQGWTDGLTPSATAALDQNTAACTDLTPGPTPSPTLTMAPTRSPATSLGFDEDISKEVRVGREWGGNGGGRGRRF